MTVNRDQLTQAILETLTSIAPEIDPGALQSTKLLRDQAYDARQAG